MQLDNINLNMAYKKTYTRSGPKRKKKAGTKRKVTSARGKKSMVSMDNDAKKQLAVMRYPHSKATLNPKIPDGASSLSLGLRIQHIHEFVMPTSVAYICCFPGLNAAFSIHEGSATEPVEIPLFFSKNHTEGSIQTDTGPFDETDFSKFRVVAQGMRIRNVNNDDANDGFYEAVRIPTSAQTSRYILSAVTEAGTPALTKAHMLPALKAVLEGTQFAQSNTFTSGSMKLMHKKYFQLKETQPVHDFQNLFGPYTLKLSAIGQSQTMKNFASTDPSDNARYVASQMDYSMDMIVVKVTGQANSTRLYVDCVSHLEFEMKPQSKFVGFQNETAYNQKGLTALRNTQRRKLLKSSN